MIVTEDEARTKICQETRGSTGGSLVCCGSLCMAWRWKITTLGASTPKGYCGKAGESVGMPQAPRR